MVIDFEIVFFVLQVVVILLIFWFRNYVPTYIKERAKNFATSQDISLITSKIEKVKSNFQSDLEVLKAELQLRHKSNFSIQEQKRQLIYKFIENLNLWFFSITNFKFSGYNTVNFGEIKSHRNNLEKCKLDFDVDSAKLDLFFQDKKFDELRFSIIDKILLLEKTLDDTILSFETNLAMLDNMTTNKVQFDYEAEWKKVIKPVHEYYENMLIQTNDIFKLKVEITQLLKTQME